jgi:autotransporter translocation and assembly factor TamB
VALTDGSMRVRLEARRFDFSWFEPLISPRIARRPHGWLDGTVEAVGDPQMPSYSGSLQFSECRVGLPALGIKLERGTAALAFDGRTVRLERARVESNGSLELKGSGTSRGPGQRTVELEATLDRFVPINTLQAKAEVSGRMEISGNLGAANVKGDVTVQRATFYAEGGGSSKVEAVSLTRRDRLQIQERFGVGAGAQSRHRPVMADSAEGRISIRIGDNVWVRRRSDPIVALELKGDVQAHKPRGLPLELRGTMGIRTGRSYLSFVGRRFEILSAQVKLPGPLDSASVYLESLYAPAGNGSTSSDVTVTANVTMDVDGVVTDLRSEPYLDRASLLNFLATGQVQGEAESGTAYGLAVGTAIGAVGGAAGRSLGLDVVQVTMDAYGGQTLSAGSYVDPRIYLGFRQSVVEGQTTGTGSTSASTPTEFEVEIEATRSLLFNLQGSTSQYRFLFRPRLGR